jgi:hypothetical protein
VTFLIQLVVLFDKNSRCNLIEKLLPVTTLKMSSVEEGMKHSDVASDSPLCRQVRGYNASGMFVGMV